jgi:hypothetical protein
MCFDNTLIKRGGGTGPMKPGNQQVTAMVPIPAEAILEDEGMKILPPSFQEGFFDIHA